MNCGGKEQNAILLPLPNCVHRQFTHQSRSLNFIAKLDCNSRKIVTHVTYHFSTHFLRQTVSKVPILFEFSRKIHKKCNTEFSQKMRHFWYIFKHCVVTLFFHSISALRGLLFRTKKGVKNSHVTFSPSLFMRSLTLLTKLFPPLEFTQNCKM